MSSLSTDHSAEALLTFSAAGALHRSSVEAAPAGSPITPVPESRVTTKTSEAGCPAIATNLRVRRIWGEWLQALAADPEAALAAALAYRELDEAGRDEWLAALDSDLVQVGATNVAVYAPLLAVEENTTRRARIAHALTLHAPEARPPWQELTALQAQGQGGCRVAVLIRPLYLDFVQVLACGFVPGRCFLWVRHDPIASRAQTLKSGALLDGLLLQDVPAKSLIDELAQTVVAHTRQGGELPDALRLFADLFGPTPAGYSVFTDH